MLPLWNCCNILPCLMRWKSVSGPGGYSPADPFVPSVQELNRLIATPGLAAALRPYQDFGFAVYELKAGFGGLLPLVVSFPRADPRQLYFPTFHASPGPVAEEIVHDHLLYCQKLPEDGYSTFLWEESAGWAHPVVSAVLARGMVHPRQHLQRLKLEDVGKNKDFILR